MLKRNFEMLKQVQHDQQGRSMVEMLGVLAIIGVLSVAGIAGYSMAMQRFRANEVVNVASVLYTLAEAHYLAGGVGDTYNAVTDAGLTLPSSITSMTYVRQNGQKGVVTVGGAEDFCNTIQGIIGNSAEYDISCS